MKPYKTLLQEGQEEFIINKSRFIGYGAPAQTEEEALAFLQKIRIRHKDASHNCYAYVIGQNAGIQRYSDDGEPGGTAGLPIIGVIKAQEVVNACVVITRYYGGIQLGAGGLVRAYSQGASSALGACGVGVMHPTITYLLSVEYPRWGRLENHLESQPVRIISTDFGADITVSLQVRSQDEASFLQGIATASDGRIEPLAMEEGYSAWVEIDNQD